MKRTLKIRMQVTAKAISGVEITGTVVSILNNTIIVAQEIEKYVVKNEELKNQGFTIPKVERQKFTVV